MSDLSNLRELYQEVIIDHNKHPRNFRVPDHYTHHAEGFNPLCGDQLTLYLTVTNNLITNINFKGSGCAISTASASLMTELLLNKTLDDAQRIFEHFHNLLTMPSCIAAPDLGKLAVLKGVQEFPSRVKCATLAWHTLNAAIFCQTEAVTTEQ